MMPDQESRHYHEPMTEPGHHVSYMELPPIEYAGLMLAMNQSNHEFYVDLLNGKLKSNHGACVIVVGSDGKFERHTQSRTEFELILPQPDGGEIRDRLMQKLLANSQSIHLELGPRGSLEVKVLTDSMPASYAFGDPDRIYPDRILNSAFILGSTETHRALRERILFEMTDSHEIGKRIRKKIKDQLTDYKKAIRTGEFRGSLNFDPSSGTQFYQESTPMQTGFKPAYIRAVQRKFDLLTIRAVRENVVTAEDILENLPSNTLEKFEFFSARNCIEPNLAISGAESYAWFLQQYHHIQEHYKSEKRPIMLQSSWNKFAYHASIIDRLLE